MLTITPIIAYPGIILFYLTPLFRYKYDDENVYEVQEEEAIDFNYGRGELNAGFSSAYMLLYIRADAMNDMMASVSSDDIPKPLISRLSHEQYCSRVEQQRDTVLKRTKCGIYASLFTEANLSEFELSALKLDRRIGSDRNDFHGFLGERRISLSHSTTMRHMFYILCTLSHSLFIPNLGLM